MSVDTTQSIEAQLDRIDAELREIREMLTNVVMLVANTDVSMTDAKTIIEKVGNEVMPTVNALTESPMLKMFLPKKAK